MELVRRFDLLDRIKLAGLVSRKALTIFYQTAGIFVNTSHYEELGYVTLEAMAHGIPVAAFTYPNFLFIKNNETGLLVEEGNAKTLALAIRSLLEDEKKQRRMGASARSYVEENHSYAKVRKRLVSTYRSII